MIKKIRLFDLNKQIILAIILSCIGSIISLFVPLMIQKLIDSKNKLFLMSKIRQIGLIVCLLLIGSIISSVSEYLQSVAGDQKIKEIRSNLQDKILRLPISFLKQFSSGELISHVVNDTLVIKDFTTTEIPSAIISLLTVIGSFIILLNLDLNLTFVILIGFSLICLGAWPLGRINQKYSYLIQNELGKVSAKLGENTNNLKIIKLSNAQEEVMSNFKTNLLKLFRLSKRIDFIFSITGPLQTFLTLGIFLLIVLYGSLRVANQTLSVGVMMSFLMYMFEVISPINDLANFYVRYSETLGALKSVNQIMLAPEETSSGPKVEKSALIQGEIQARNIIFSYPNSVEPILKNVNLSFDWGKRIALVGPSGSGKTTLINIITRLEDNYKGKILLNDTDAKEYRLDSWRSLFSVVTQENSIFSGSILGNLTLGLKEKPDRKKIYAALEKANLLEDIQNMPKGLLTQVGEHGNQLSGGQNQRLQLARAYLRNTPCLILDEATSNLDPEAEMKVTRAIDQISKNKIVIIIAHRLSTIVNADRIYFLDHQHIEGVGKHADLMKQVPKYKRFVQDQIISDNTRRCKNAL